MDMHKHVHAHAHVHVHAHDMHMCMHMSHVHVWVFGETGTHECGVCGALEELAQSARTLGQLAPDSGQVMILHPQTAQTGRNAGSGDIELYGFMAVYRLVV